MSYYPLDRIKKFVQDYKSSEHSEENNKVREEFTNDTIGREAYIRDVNIPYLSHIMADYDNDPLAAIALLLKHFFPDHTEAVQDDTNTEDQQTGTGV